MIALALNAGSSSLKLAVFSANDDDETLLLRAAVEGIGRDDARVWRQPAGRPKQETTTSIADHVAAFERARAILDEASVAAIDVVGHRLVHGGPNHLAPIVVDPAVRRALDDAVPFAPLHLPVALSLLDLATRAMPDVPQVASFDTAFHRDLPERARRFPIPQALHDAGLRRYGFHGLSFTHAVHTLGEALGARAIVAHLGSGSSLVALRDRRPIDTTMGLTPMGGVVMGTRPGDLDPGLVAQLAKRGLDLEHLFDRESGLKAIAETTSDVRALLATEATDARAAAALEAFCVSTTKAIGAYAALLGGLDTLVFTGGIGEHAPSIRARICAPLAFMGVALDPAKNAANGATIGASSCDVRIVEADEERVIAREAIDQARARR